MSPADLFNWQEVAGAQAQADMARDRWHKARERRRRARTGMKRRREVELQDACHASLRAELDLARAEAASEEGSH